jgi:hypothetical protein
MPRNENAHVLDLLAWHGHDAGGVRVPFRGGGEPLGRLVETPLVLRLQKAAADIADGGPASRWIFLVGGPGNGKSQMVELFVRELGAQLACESELVKQAQEAFSGRPLQRLVVLEPTNGNPLSERFQETVGRLVIVQDASATSDATGDAAADLAADLAALLTHEAGLDRPTPIVIVCANRGLLVRAMAVADDARVLGLLGRIVRATGLSADALLDPMDCWPLDTSGLGLPADDLVATWPLDMESLASGSDQETPLDTIVQHAVAPERWDEADCGTCSSVGSCPLYANAASLRDEDRRRNALAILRRAELASGQRWNFRAAYSLAAELVIGQRDDFRLGEVTVHPCAWVHSRLDDADSDDPARSLPAACELTTRLYHEALFPSPNIRIPSGSAELTTQYELPATEALVRSLATPSARATTAIRRRLGEEVATVLDPAEWSPRSDEDPLGELENGFAQSIGLGREAWTRHASIGPIEARLLALLEAAEAECLVRLQGIYSARAGESVRYIRQVACRVAKRAVGCFVGVHGNDDRLKEYEASLRDQTRLNELQNWLRQLLGHPQFTADALETFGQARAEDAAVAILEASRLRIRSTPAPLPTPTRPAHDLPVIRVDEYPVPLTYGLFQALQLKREGCASGSLPASVRALLDRIRQVHAGTICRDVDDFIEGGAALRLRGRGVVAMDSAESDPRFRVS